MKRPIGMSQEGGFLPGTLPNREVTKEEKKKLLEKKMGKKLCKLVRPEEWKSTTEPEMKIWITPIKTNSHETLKTDALVRNAQNYR